MTTSISCPGEPVTKGATPIQSTNFVVVAADWARVQYADVVGVFSRAKFANIRNFPKTDPGDLIWAKRTDLVGTTNLSIMGFKVLSSTKSDQATVPTTGTSALVPITEHVVMVHSWYTVIITLTNGIVLTRLAYQGVTTTVYVDPETGAILSMDGASKHLMEAFSSLFKPQAAGYPLLTGGIASLISGDYPLV